MSVKEITVKQLNTYVKTLLESDLRLNYISVKGEISNFKSHFSSGHWYFTLKDNEAAVKCIMFSACANRVKFMPEDGMSVVLRGRISLYEKDGQYQFCAEEMCTLGEGELAAEFLRIKEKLQKEGLFDTDSKRPVKKFPKKIAVITSGSGAASEDIKNILSRRYPICEVIMCPVSVQGYSASAQMIAVLDRVYALQDIDTVIIGRGGGSAEDLQAFNDEALVRKVYESPFPVISAVGHETDFTLCDFVADLRAPTPSAAAELAVPDIKKIRLDILRYKSSIENNLKLKYKMFFSQYSMAVNTLSANNPQRKIERYSDKLYTLKKKCKASALHHINDKKALLSENASKLDALSPLKIISRGFAVAECDGKIIRSVEQISPYNKISITLSDGSAECTVDSISKKV